MKRLFYIVMLFFALAVPSLLEQDCFQIHALESLGYIQNVKSETVVLVSNNILNGEIASSQLKKDQTFSGSTPLVLNYHTDDRFYQKNKTQFNGCFIHNLSTNYQKVHQIRAP